MCKVSNNDLTLVKTVLTEVVRRDLRVSVGDEQSCASSMGPETFKSVVEVLMECKFKFRPEVWIRQAIKYRCMDALWLILDSLTEQGNDVERLITLYSTTLHYAFLEKQDELTRKLTDRMKSLLMEN